MSGRTHGADPNPQKRSSVHPAHPAEGAGDVTPLHPLTLDPIPPGPPRDHPPIPDLRVPDHPRTALTPAAPPGTAPSPAAAPGPDHSPPLHLPHQRPHRTKLPLKAKGTRFLHLKETNQL